MAVRGEGSGMYFVRQLPYEIISKDRNGYFLRYADGTVIYFTNDEMKTVFKIPTEYSGVVLTEKEIEMLKKLKNHIFFYKRASPKYVVVYKVTSGCNLQCKYCYEWANPEKIKIHGKMRVLDGILKKFGRGKLRLIFHGGEPLLYFDSLILPFLKKHARKLTGKNPKLGATLQTNGVLLRDMNFAKKVADAMDKYDLGVGVSLDGLKKHNWMRVKPDGTNAWDDTMQGICNMLDLGQSVGVISVINDRSVKDMLKIVKFFDKTGVRGMRLNPLYPAGHPEVVKHAPDPDEYDKGLVKVMKWLVKRNTNGEEPMDISTISEIVDKMFGAITCVCSSVPCGAGNGFYAVEPNGEIRPCDHSDIVLGSVLDESWTPERAFDNKELVEFMKNQVTRTKAFYNEECSACPYRVYCQCGGCPSFDYDIYGKSFGKRRGRICLKRTYEYIEKLMLNHEYDKLKALSPKIVGKNWDIR